MGGGGDGGFVARQESQDREKQAARERLNALFGVAPTGDASAAINPADFYRTVTVQAPIGSSAEQVSGGPAAGGQTTTSSEFDQAAYDAAVAARQAMYDESAKNKAGLDALFASVRAGAFDAGKRRLDENKGQAARNLKFELFARGLNGGSVDVDQNQLLGRTYSQGITDLGGKADQLQTQFKGDNEATRLNLLQSIDSGMDSGSALSSALQQMRVNADRSAADAIGTDVGDLFSNAALIYNQNRVSQGRQNASNWWQQQAPSGYRSGSPGARSGTVSFAG